MNIDKEGCFLLFDLPHFFSDLGSGDGKKALIMTSQKRKIKSSESDQLTGHFQSDQLTGHFQSFFSFSELFLNIYLQNKQLN